MEAGIRLFHRFKVQATNDQVLIYEPVANKYVWLETYVDPPLRSKGRSAALVSDAMGALPGTHYLHFSPLMSNFNKLARIQKWNRVGDSEWFDNCIAYEHDTRRHSRRKLIVFDIYEVLSKCPRLHAFSSRNEYRGALGLINNTFNL